MKSLRYIILGAAALAACQNLGAWGSTGHKIVAELALRQLGTGASARISSLFPDGLAEEASWADQHRRDEEYAFTDSYHTMAMNHDYAYDPGWRMWRGGDCVTGLHFVDYNLRYRSRLDLTDSVLIFNIRMLVHIVGDMHCLAHGYIMPEENHWDCTFESETTTYHTVVDKIPSRIYKKVTAADAAASLDTYTDSQKQECCSGSFEDWAQECCLRDKVMYEVNPLYTAELAPDTIERLTPAAQEALRVSGYRLGFLLNKYFNN